MYRSHLHNSRIITKMNNDNIYQIKIDQFINITQESDIEIAKKYLMKYNWNVEVFLSN